LKKINPGTKKMKSGEQNKKKNVRGDREIGVAKSLTKAQSLALI